MAYKEKAVEEKITYSGFGDLNSIYAFGTKLFKDYNYTLIEKDYSEKIQGNSKEIKIGWEASKIITNYFKVLLKIGWSIPEITNVEVEIEGKKTAMNRFKDLSIKIEGFWESGHKEKAGETYSKKFFRSFFHKAIRKKIKELEEEIIKEIEEIKEEFKAFMDLTAKKDNIPKSKPF